MWIIAAIPFALVGALFVYGGLGCFLGVERRPHETPIDLARQMVIGVTIGTIFLAAAAKIAS